MRKTWKWGAVLGLGLLAVGCFETKQDYTLNPDGSGKVTYEVAMQDMSAMMGAAQGGEGAAKPQADIKQGVRQILDRSGGIDTWKDITFSKGDDGRIRFKGTAYFGNVEKLKLQPGGPSGVSFVKDETGGLVLLLEGEKKEAGETKPPAALTDEQVAAQIKEQRAKFQQMKPLMTAIMGTMKMDLSFHVPGTIAESTCFKKGEGGTLQLTVEGAKLLEAMDKVASDDALMRDVAASGESVSEGGAKTSLIMNEKIFGEKAPVRARMTGDLKPLFDYRAEMEAAKKDYPEMFKRLGLDQVKVQTPGDMPPLPPMGTGEPGGGKAGTPELPAGKGDGKPEAKPPVRLESSGER